MASSEQQLAAAVLLRPASGKKIDGYTRITAANIGEFRPSEGTVRAAAAFFRDEGFAVGPCVGISFSITGSTAVFERTFGAKVEVSEGAGQVVAEDGTRTSDFNLDRLPPEVRELVTAVGFERATDFGPGAFL